MSRRVLVLGADGYLGWPSCMHHTALGDAVLGVDNYFRRQAALALDAEALIPTPNLSARARVLAEVAGTKVEVRIGDITDYSFLLAVFREFQPDTVVHFAEQPSAPYSMIDHDTAAFTLRNNLMGTLNLCHAVRETDPSCHIVKLGTMGEYGTPNIDIEEGWLDVEHKGRRDRFLFPRQAGSLYHTTKIQDTDLLWFYVRTWGLRVTDLMQGPVYGLSTDEADRDERLLPNFHYDEVFGTVFNRFVVQAVAGHPLTVYGSGGQTRGYLNLRDTLKCVALAAATPAAAGELRVLNQVTELFSVNQIAARVQQVAAQLGFDVRVQRVANPRVESEEHYYNPTFTGLRSLGLTPTLLTDEILAGMLTTAARYRERVNRRAIFRGISWR